MPNHYADQHHAADIARALSPAMTDALRRAIQSGTTIVILGGYPGTLRALCDRGLVTRPDPWDRVRSRTLTRLGLMVRDLLINGGYEKPPEPRTPKPTVANEAAQTRQMDDPVDDPVRQHKLSPAMVTALQRTPVDVDGYFDADPITGEALVYRRLAHYLPARRHGRFQLTPLGRDVHAALHTNPQTIQTPTPRPAQTRRVSE